MRKLTAPCQPIPEPLRGKEPGSFAERTMSVRIPNIGRLVLDSGDWPRETAEALQDLIEGLPYGLIKPLQDNGAPDSGDWEGYIAPYLSHNWLEVPWFFAETYFFRRILEATGYYQPGIGRGVDPYATLKHQGITSIPDGLRPLCAQMEALRAASRSSLEQSQNAITHLFRMAIWGNQADLSMWWSAEHKRPDRPERDNSLEYLLDDDAAQASQYLFTSTDQPLRVDFILDNGGIELGYDLALVDLLLDSGRAHKIWFHVKPHPTYVSDVTAQDVLDTVEFLADAEDPCVRELSHRVQSYLSDRRLRMKHDYYWTSPLSGWEMSSVLRQDLSHSDFIISKGDANYRRWLGDRHWPFTTPKEQVWAYLPAPLVALRVLKSEVIIGLLPHQPEELYQKDPSWMYDGKYGVIQFVA
jgi:hypothetical protein